VPTSYERPTKASPQLVSSPQILARRADVFIC
jgi:hypothetical protein